MALDIRPFDAETSDVPEATDSRSTTFMDELRARVAKGDEKQREKWAKAVKPAAPRKPLTPARPDWLNAPKPPKAAQVPEKAARSLPFKSSKKKRDE